MNSGLCPANYTYLDGNSEQNISLPGEAENIAICANNCSRNKACCSFQWSPTNLLCKLNSNCDPEEDRNGDYFYCVKEYRKDIFTPVQLPSGGVAPNVTSISGQILKDMIEALKNNTRTIDVYCCSVDSSGHAVLLTEDGVSIRNCGNGESCENICNFENDQNITSEDSGKVICYQKTQNNM